MPDPNSRPTPPPTGRNGVSLNGGSPSPLGPAPTGPADPRWTPTPAPKAMPSSMRGFLPAFLGMLAALVLVAAIGAGVWLGVQHFSASSTTTTTGGPALNKPSTWVLSAEPAQPATGEVTPDIGWWTRTFDLPPTDSVTGYLKSQGLTVTRVVPVHYEDAADATTITYQVQGAIPDELIRVPKASWVPSDPELRPFAPVVVLSPDLPAGQFWNTAQQSVAQPAGTPVNVTYNVRLDKNAHTVSADRIAFADGVFTPQQVAGYETETNNVVSALKAQVQAIDARVQADAQVRLAQVPADPPKPELMSTDWDHGDGSGEPTRSAERMGGGTAAGAAGGAALGAAAGDAGLGAGIGAAAGLLGGFLYDTVSKNNDRHRYEAHARAVNAERMSQWRGQVKALNQQRDQVKKDAEAEKQQQIQDLVTRLASAGGNVDALPMPADTPQPAPPSETPIPLPNPPATPLTSPAPASASDQAPSAGNVPQESTPDQPSGPVHPAGAAH